MIQAERFAHGLFQPHGEIGLPLLHVPDVLRIPPRQTPVEYGLATKPKIIEESPIRFSVSHSSSAAVTAISEGSETGVDVEYRQPPGPPVSSEIFSSGEINRIQASSVRLASFCDEWTLKEAVLKAPGFGFSSSETQTDLTPGSVSRFREFAVQNLNVAVRFSAALAIQCARGQEIRRIILHEGHP